MSTAGRRTDTKFRVEWSSTVLNPISKLRAGCVRVLGARFRLHTILQRKRWEKGHCFFVSVDCVPYNMAKSMPRIVPQHVPRNKRGVSDEMPRIMRRGAKTLTNRWAKHMTYRLPDHIVDFSVNTYQHMFQAKCQNMGQMPVLEQKRDIMSETINNYDQRIFMTCMSHRTRSSPKGFIAIFGVSCCWLVARRSDQNVQRDVGGPRFLCEQENCAKLCHILERLSLVFSSCSDPHLPQLSVCLCNCFVLQRMFVLVPCCLLPLLLNALNRKSHVQRMHHTKTMRE